MRSAATLLVVLVVALGSACERRERPPAEEPLLVLAAADLQQALPALAERFAAAGGAPLRIVYGSTGNLTTQIEQGAPGDVFLAANESFIDRLERSGQLVGGTRRVYALGRLALVWRAGVPAPAGLAELARPEYGTLAMANPEHAPYGAAAREALANSGVWDAVAPRLVLGENVAQALQFVTTGNADAGLVALPLVTGPTARPHLPVPAGAHAPLRQTAAVLRASARPGDALRFLDLVSGPEGREILDRYGFLPPDP